MHLNVRILLQKNKIGFLISLTEPDVLILTESWLKKSISDAKVAINNYYLFRINSVGGGRGGDCILILF